MTQIVDNIFDNVKYWQNKKLLLQAIPPEYFMNKNIIIRLLGVTTQSISASNEAKRGMWNHMIVHEGLGDDILQATHKTILDDIDFARQAVPKYNRTYIYLSRRLKASKDIARSAASAEKDISSLNYTDPILKHMPEIFQKDNEIAMMATTRNINNLQYAINLRRNKYFIIDMMNFMEDFDTKQKILRYIDQDLLNDKKFVSKLGCFDHMCEQYKGDTQFVAHAVEHDISILKKTQIFDESIIKGALNNDDIYTSRETVISAIFRYIERFNSGYDELDSKIKDKNILHILFWEMGELITDEFV